MDKLRLGRTDLMVSRVAFGGIPIQRVSEAEAVAVVQRCLSLGINFIDTANAYTNSEERIGKAIANLGREDLIIATKTLSRDREEVEEHLALSLKRLGTDYIDLYQFHNISNDDMLAAVLAANGPLAVATDAQRRGFIRHIGVTSHSLDMARKLVACGHFETIMFPFNFVTHESADKLLPLAAEHDAGFIAMKPLEGGRLDDVSLAFRYLLQFPDICIVVGIEQPGEIDEIVRITEQSASFTAADTDEVARLRQEMGQAFCRRCDYCQPCPEEIPISFVMDYPSLCNRLPAERIFVEFAAVAMEKAARCTECGECEQRCPYDLPIREIIKGYVARHQVNKAKFLAAQS